MLWFGWFGFNAGSALQDEGAAPLAFLNTQLGAAGAMLGWIVMDRVRFGQVGMIGMLTSAVAGMVAITPACGEVSPIGATIIGIAAGLVCSFAIGFKYKFGIDDTLDVVGVHGWGGVTGLVMVGLLSTGTFTGEKGLLYGGGPLLLGKQVLALLATAAFSFTLTWLIAKAINQHRRVPRIGRIRRRPEPSGHDLLTHAVEAPIQSFGDRACLGRRPRSVFAPLAPNDACGGSRSASPGGLACPSTPRSGAAGSAQRC